jgi:hypothetical protein
LAPSRSVGSSCMSTWIRSSENLGRCVPLLRRVRPTLSKERVLEIARTEAARQGWDWEEPIHVWTARESLFWGPIRWIVRTNGDSFGCNVWVTVEDATGNILRSGFAKR